MKPDWGDLNARARGLRSHLLDPPRLRGLARETRLPVLVRAIERAGYGPAPDTAGRPEGIELMLRRGAARRYRTLLRFARPARAGRLAVVFEDEDRRSLRAMVRGAAAGADPEARLAGLIPTPGLPERALAELARQESPARVAALLSAWNHPYAPALRSAATSRPDLFRIEVALDRLFAARAARAAGRAGRALRRFVAETIDVENARAAMVLAGTGGDVRPEECFLAGGTAVPLPLFARAARASHPAAALTVLAPCFSGTPLQAAFREGRADPASLGSSILGARIEGVRREARLDPVAPWPLLQFVLEQRAEIAALRRILWGLWLGAPPGEPAAVLKEDA